MSVMEELNVFCMRPRQTLHFKIQVLFHFYEMRLQAARNSS